MLPLDKPAGVTSRELVNRAGRLLGEKRCGHTGTLDPDATGVLVVMVGRATKASQWLTDSRKTYVADVRFGATTTSDDSQGEPLATYALPAPWCAETLAAAANTTTPGVIAQVPPAVSALKRDGVRDHVRVRRGEDVSRPPREVTLHSARLLEVTGDDTARFEVSCGSGFYVRAWARDLGAALGSGAHLTGLRRVESSGFHVDDCLNLDALEPLTVDERRAQLLTVERALESTLPTVQVSAEASAWLEFGKRPPCPAEQDPGTRDAPVLVVDPAGASVCVARVLDSEEGPILRVIRGLRARLPSDDKPPRATDGARDAAVDSAVDAAPVDPA